MPDTFPEKQNPSLLRIALIDTKILPGRVEMIPLEGHTAVTGSNGAGKTSLIQLMAIFYGSNPGDVIRTNERDSFIDFYLPRLSSFIGYEYRNAQGQVRSVILHADPERRFLQYRLVRGALKSAMFIAPDDDGGHFVQNGQLSRRLLDLDIDHERALVTSYTDFRSIILNLPDTGRREKNSGRLAVLKRDFSLSTRVAPLTGLETLMTQMLSNNISLATLLSTAAMRVLESGKIKVQILGDHKAHQMARFPAELAGYRRVMSEEQTFRRIDLLQREHEDAQAEIDERSAAVLHLQALAENDLSSLKSQKALREEDAGRIRKSALDIEDTHKREMSDLSMKDREIRAELDAIGRRDRTLRADSADTASDLHATLPALQAREVIELEAVRDAKSGSAHIMANFDAHKSDIVTNTSAMKDAVRERATQESAAADAAAEAARAAMRERIDTLRDDEAALKDRNSAARVVIAEDISELKLAVAETTADADMVERDAAQKAILEGLNHDCTTAAGNLAVARDSHQVAVAAAMTSDTALQIAKRDSLAATERHEALVTAHSPKPGSLLSFLRQSDASWAETIGRVIAPELLHRKGLTPSWIDGAHDTIFGLKLDITDLPSVPEADTAVIEQSLATAFANVARAQDVEATSQISAERDAKALHKAKRHLSESEERLRACEAKNVRGKAAYAAFMIVLGNHVDDRKAGILAKLAARKSDLVDLTDRTARDVSEMTSAFATARQNEIDLDSDIRSRAASIIARERASIAEIDASHALRLSEVIASRDAALKDEGFDAAELSRREARLQATQGNVARAREAGTQAESWVRHCSDMERVPLLEAEIAKTAAVIRQKTHAYDQFARDNVAAAAEIAKDIDCTAKSIAQRIDTLGSMAIMIKTLRDGVSPVDNRFSSAGFEVNRDQINVLTKTCKKHAKDISAVVNTLTSVFRRSNNASIVEFVNDIDDGEMSMADRISRLGSWFDDQGAVAYTLLMQGIKSMCQPIRTAYHDLRDADDAIVKIGRKLGSEIRSMKTFPHVRNIDLTIGSQMKTQPFWADLEAFDKSMSAYERAEDVLTGSIDEEADALVAALEKLLTHWSDGSIPVVDLRQMLYIEGSITERDNQRRISRNTDLSDISSNGNTMILRLIIFTAMLNVMRQGQDIGLVWAVDEIAALDKDNLSSLLEMLSSNNISLITAAPRIETDQKEIFDFHVRLNDGGMLVFPLGTSSTQKAALPSFQDDIPFCHPEQMEQNAADLEEGADTVIEGAMA